MVNFTQVRKVIRNFKKEYLEHHICIRFVKALLWVIAAFPSFCVGANMMGDKSFGVMLAIIILFTDMVIEDYKTQLIDIRKAAVLIILLIYVSPYPRLHTMLFYLANVTFFLLINFCLVVGNWCAEHLSKLSRVSGCECLSENNTPLLQIPMLPFIGAAISIYGTVRLICALDFFYALDEVSRYLINAVNNAPISLEEFFIISSILLVLMLIATVATALVLCVSDIYKDTKVKEINGFVAISDIGLLAAFVSLGGIHSVVIALIFLLLVSSYILIKKLGGIVHVNKSI